ncbi:MAG: hypothetical protein JXA53_09320, partial [Bacteroidales bacterium]|nr:hypothetical protein [Bacteroidales bacterium]
MKKTRVILLLSIILVNLSAQITDNKIEFTKPSIEAASLGVYGNMDVSKYTGRLNVNVPIYQIKTQRISLPISLSYNTSGVRLTDIAGWVGLNWSLNAGGIITRTVIGDADPIGIVPYETNMIEPDIKTMKFKDIYVCTASNMNTEPDIFNYNFLGYSGQFVIDSKGGIILSNPNHIKISPQPDGNGWVIYTKEGHKLYFNKEERVKTTSVYETRCVFGNWTDTPDSHSDNLNITAWYLTKIEDIQTNDYIELFYSNIKSVNETQSSRTYYTPLDVIVKPLEMGKTWIKREEIVPLLDSIVFAEGKVEFIKESGRLDYSDQESGCKLTEIKISSKDSKSLSYLFQSSYKSNRLILNAITRSNSNNQKEKYYSFEYDNQEMPDRDSPARDFWGYFNGRTQNSYYVPAYLEYKGDDWSPNPLTMKALSLNKITYPTGGYTYIELEPHEYSMDKEGERLTFSNTGKNVQKDFSKNFKNFIDYDRYKPKWDTLTIEGSTQTVCVSNNFPDNSFVLQIRKQNAAHEHIGAYSNGNYQVVLTKGIYEAALIDTEQNNDIEIPSQYESTIFYVKSSSSNKSIAGGLRVKKLTNVSEKGKVEVKKYEYQLSGTPYSSGIQTWSNLFYCDDFYVLKEINTLTYERYKIRNSDLVNSQELMRNSPVVYKEVKEITEGDGYEGCIISKYSTIVDYPDYYFNPSAIIGKAKVPGSFPFMFEPINFNDWARGQVIEEIILNNKNETVKKSTFNYNIIPRTSVKGRKFGFALPPTGVFNDEDHCKICITDYFITVGFTELSERIDTSYFYHNNTLSYLTQKMNYNYEPINNLLIEESVQESIKNRVSNQYYYPSNIPNSFFIPASNYNELTESCLFGKLVG